MPIRTVAFLFFTFLSTQAFAEPRKVGLAAPLSGGGAGWGNDVRNTLVFASEKLAPGQYKFIFEDDRCDPKTSLSVAKKFTSIDRVSGVFLVCGQSVMATAKVYTDAHIPVLASLATPSRISELKIFRTSLSDAIAAEMLAKYISTRHQKVAVLTEQNDYPISFLEDFVKSSQVLKLEVQNENYLPQQEDFRAQLLKLKALKIEALFLNTQTEQALHKLVKQLKELNFSPSLYGAYLPASANFLSMAGSLADGIVLVDFPGAEEFMTEEGRELFAEYVKRFGPINGWSFAFPATFEAFRAFHLASTSGEEVEEYLLKSKFKGIFGPYSFDEHGDVVGPKHLMRVVKDGKAVVLSH